MDDNTVRVAVGLCLGVPLCHPHLCRHCGEEVGQLGTHGLSCKFSQGLRQPANVHAREHQGHSQAS